MYLRTFGGLSVETDTSDGTVPSLGPRRLALLAVIAAAEPRGITRERIIGILWSETDDEQARHTLSQTIYKIRRETGGVCITGGAQLRLDAALASDVAQFQDALNRDDLTRAAALYSGAFLDGFYLTGAPEFEQWVEETRARLQFAVTKALETLARRSVDAAAHADAANWWRRLLELDPFNATYAAGRVRALMALGDHAGALRSAREYESRMRRELDAEPHPSMRELTSQLRATSPATPPAVTAPASTVAVTAAAPAAEATVATAASPRVRRRVLLSALLLGGLALAMAAWRINGSMFGPAPTLPLLAVGAIEARDTSTLAPVLRDLLATNLGRLSGIRVVSNSRLLELLPAERGSANATTDAARRAGANEIIEGELSVAASGLVLTLRRVALRNGEVVQGYTVRAADLFALTDSATHTIASDLGLDAPPTAASAARTRSSVAYALYEQGLRAFHAADYAAAAQLMYAALGRDSTFAMAAAYAWRTSINLARFDEANRDLPTVKRLAARAPERERLLIETLIAKFGGAPLSDLLASARRLTERYPDEPDGHFLLGAALYNAGEWANAIASFNRAIAIDSAAGPGGAGYCRMCDAIAGVRDSYMWWDSAAAAERTGRRAVALLLGNAVGWALRVEPLLRLGRRAEAEAANATASRLWGRSAIDYHALYRDLIRSGRLDELETRIVAEVETAPPELIGELPWLLAIVLRNQGRPREAIELARNGAVPGTNRRASHSEPITHAIGTLEAGRSREAAWLFLAMVKEDHTRKEGAGFVARNLSWHMTLAATALAEAGDTAMVRALADSVQRIGPQSSFGRDTRLPYFLRGLLLQRQHRHAEAVNEFRRAIFSNTDGYTRINLELARSLVALQRFPEAIAVLQPTLRGGVDGANAYVTHTELHEALAHAFYAAGQLDSAAVHYAAVERAWRKADPNFAARYQTAKLRAVAPAPDR